MICTNVTQSGAIYGYWQIAPDTWCITNRWKNFMYLIEGEEKAVLIDTGDGEGNIREVTEKITKKPVMAVNTHGHFDHTGGNPCWPEVWMTKEAALHAKEPFDDLHRQWYNNKRYPDYQIRYFEEGETIELGGRSLEVISIPAHSEGSVAFLDDRMRYLFCGDELEGGQVIWFVRNEPAALKEQALMHKKNMEKLMSRLDEFDWIWPAHNGAPLFPLPYLQDFIELDLKIMEGTQDVQKNTAGFGFPEDHHAVPNLFYSYGKLKRASNGLANVVYSEAESVYLTGK
ncbi:MAG: MBL fold metallo-hydrolase [Hespellia sp.]|nr:MBL fold metallo-hydrolase [Hespellia sp.]